MPKLEVYVISKRTLERTVAFAKGVMKVDSNWEVKVVPLKNFLQNGFSKDLRPGDAIAIWGILRGAGVLLHEARKRKIDYYFMDHSYFKSANQVEEWYRIEKNNHSCTSLKIVSNKRWDKFFKIKNKIMPWKTQATCGPNILVCPPTQAVSWYQNLHFDWSNYIVKKLKEFLPQDKHKNIKVRLKPNEPIVDQKGNLIKLEPNKNDTPLLEDLNNCHCVIAYNSNVALQATMMGIPVIVQDISPCLPISYKLNDLKKKDRELEKTFNQEPKHRIKLLYWLSHNQWNLNEIQDGTAWKMLKENEK